MSAAIFPPCVVQSRELADLLEKARHHRMTDAEIEAQRQSLARGLSARCEHGRADFEQCPDCRGWT